MSTALFLVFTRSPLIRDYKFSVIYGLNIDILLLGPHTILTGIYYSCTSYHY
jgi:hypothetical protein